MDYIITLSDKSQVPLESSFFPFDELERKRVRLKFSWVPLSELKDIELYPLGIKEKLVNLSNNIECFVYIENQ